MLQDFHPLRVIFALISMEQLLDFRMEHDLRQFCQSGSGQGGSDRV